MEFISISEISLLFAHILGLSWQPSGYGGPIEWDRMDLQPGEYVKTASGDIGKVVQISRLTIFVAFPMPGRDDLVQAYLESQLTKVDRPDDFQSAH